MMLGQIKVSAFNFEKPKQNLNSISEPRYMHIQVG